MENENLVEYYVCRPPSWDNALPEDIRDPVDVQEHMHEAICKHLEFFSEKLQTYFDLISDNIDMRPTDPGYTYLKEEDLALLKELLDLWIAFSIENRNVLDAISKQYYPNGKVVLECLGANVYVEISRCFFLLYQEQVRDALRMKRNNPGVFNDPDTKHVGTKIVRTYYGDFPEFMTRQWKEGNVLELLNPPRKPPEDPDKKKDKTFEELDESTQESEEDVIVEEPMAKWPEKKCAIQLTQFEFMYCVKMLARYIDAYPSHAFLEDLTLGLFFNYGIFTSRTHDTNRMNCPLYRSVIPMRFEEEDTPVDVCVFNKQFACFSYFYLSRLMSRNYLRNLLTGSKFVARETWYNNALDYDEFAGRLTEWIENVLVHRYDQDVFKDKWGKSCNECYVFPGDVEWCRYLYPRGVTTTLDRLKKLRKGLVETLLSYRGLTIPTVRSTATEDFKGHRLIMNLLGIAWEADVDASLNWRDHFVFFHDRLINELYRLSETDAMSYTRIVKQKGVDEEEEPKEEAEPIILIQIQGNLGVWFKGQFYECSSDLEAVILWHYMLIEETTCVIQGIDIQKIMFDRIFQKAEPMQESEEDSSVGEYNLL